MVPQKIMAVVRGAQPRMSEITFYSYFKHLRIRYIGDKKTGWIVENKIPSHVDYVNAPLRPVWGIDPVTTILGPLHTHRSWQEITHLEKYLQDAAVINISDSFYFYCGQCARIAKKRNKKLVTIVWENIPHHPSTYIPPYAANVKAVVESTDLFIARSTKSIDYLHSLGVKDKRIRMIYKGINMDDFHPVYKKEKTKTIRILYVGQLVKSKGIQELLDVFIRLYNEFPKIELWLCGRSGGEPYEGKVKVLAKQFPIRLLQNIPYDKLPEIYQSCDIYCHLSQDWKYFGVLPGGNEWFSYAIMEAMASALPIVATNVGGLPEQLGEKNFLVRQKDVETVYLALKTLIENPNMRKDTGDLNRKRAVQLFDIKKQAAKTEEAILSIL